MEIKFRRNTQSTKTREVLKRFIAVLVFGIIFIYGLHFLSKQSVAGYSYLDIYCLENTNYIIKGDTVSYDNFATYFLKAMHIEKLEVDSARISVRCYIPKSFTTGQIQDVLQIIQATHPIYELKIAK